MKLGDKAKYIRSKNAGPFWVTADIFFETAEDYAQAVDSGKITAEAVGRIYAAAPEDVRIFSLPQLKVIKISYPRQTPQGSPDERDMHSGQQYLPLLDLEI